MEPITYPHTIQALPDMVEFARLASALLKQSVHVVWTSDHISEIDGQHYTGWIGFVDEDGDYLDVKQADVDALLATVPVMQNPKDKVMAQVNKATTVKELKAAVASLLEQM
jgi:hypothetical protein